MKRIGITQRVVYIERLKERRDVLDHRWYDFAKELEIELVPIPNNLESPDDYASSLEIKGLIFSGGNNIALFGDEIIEGKNIKDDDVAYERDQTEKKLLRWASNKKIEVVGVCRGLQFINAFYKGTQLKVDSKLHVAQDHLVVFTEPDWKKLYGSSFSVNSYHNWGITKKTLSSDLRPTAFFSNEEVEAFQHLTFPIYGIMWHPERYTHVRTEDLNFFRWVFNV